MNLLVNRRKYLFAVGKGAWDQVAVAVRHHGGLDVFLGDALTKLRQFEHLIERHIGLHATLERFPDRASLADQRRDSAQAQYLVPHGTDYLLLAAGASEVIARVVAHPRILEQLGRVKVLAAGLKIHRDIAVTAIGMLVIVNRIFGADVNR